MKGYNLLAQQVPQLTIGILNPYYHNPAYGGTTSYSEISLGSRYQWLSKDLNGQTPITNYLSFYSPINKHHTRGNSKKGSWNTVGLNVSHDKASANRLFSSQFSFAHNLPVTESGRISGALSLGFLQFKTDGTDFILADDVDPVLNGIGKMSSLNLTAGLWYYTKFMYAGISMKQVLSTLRVTNSNGVAPLDKHYSALAGTHFPLNAHIDLMASINTKLIPNVPLSTEVGFLTIFEHRYWIGGQLRVQESFAFLAGLIVANSFDLTISYDAVFNGLSAFNYGSMELMLEYKFRGWQIIPCPDQFW